MTPLSLTCSRLLVGFGLHLTLPLPDAEQNFPRNFLASPESHEILLLSSLLRHTHGTEVINGNLTGYLFNKGNKPKHKEGWLKKEFLNKLQDQQLILLFCKQGLTVIFLTLATSQIYLWTSCPEITALCSIINIQGTQPHRHTQRRR